MKGNMPCVFMNSVTGHIVESMRCMILGQGNYISVNGTFSAAFRQTIMKCFPVKP